MNLLTNTTPLALWQDIVKQAENKCSVNLKKELESYLISLLMRYTDKPEVVKEIIATNFLQALSNHKNQRDVLQNIGDQCLLFAGLFPRVAEKRLVKLSYFVGLGQGAYATISSCANDLYDSLALQFVVLMDVLQSIPQERYVLLPLEAYEQWTEVGSQRALKILQGYTNCIPLKIVFP